MQANVANEQLAVNTLQRKCFVVQHCMLADQTIAGQQADEREYSTLMVKRIRI